MRSSAIMQKKTEHLIKSGGGNGPVKPGNLRRQGAKSGGDYRKMRLMTKLVAPSADGVFLIA